ncbi:jg4397, partial [Pararge aegeria aegeria]
NETADSCAKTAVESGSLDHFKNSSQDLCTLAKTYMETAWKIFWNDSKLVKGKFYATIQQNIPRQPWFCHSRSTNRWTSSTISRLRLGHASTPVHLAKLRIRDNSIFSPINLLRAFFIYKTLAKYLVPSWHRQKP